MSHKNHSSPFGFNSQDNLQDNALSRKRKTWNPKSWFSQDSGLVNSFEILNI